MEFENEDEIIEHIDSLNNIDDGFKDVLKSAFIKAYHDLENEKDTKFKYEIVPENFAKVVSVSTFLRKIAMEPFDTVEPVKIDIHGYITAKFTGIDINEETKNEICSMISNTDRIGIDPTTDGFLNIEIVIGNVQRKVPI